MKILFCEECDKNLDFIYINGYDFGDRLMEGVMFKVKLVNEKYECIGVKENSEPYMAQFNWEHWKKRCEDFVDDYDIATCPECGYDVIINEEISTPDATLPKD
jgi:hypothetical protein